MATKNNPGKFDCYAAAGNDEPIFILRANDPLAPVLVHMWALARRHEAGALSVVFQRLLDRAFAEHERCGEKEHEAFKCVREMEAFKLAQGR